MLRLPAARQPRPRTVIVTAALAGLAVSLSGCGGSAKAATPPPAVTTPTLAPALQGDPTRVVDAAAATTTAAKTSGVTVTVPVFQEGALASVNGEGNIAFAADHLRLVVPNADKAEERQFGRTLYVLLPEQLAAASGGKTWVKLDLDTPKPSDPDPFRLYAYDPEQLLRVTSAVTGATLVGTETIRDTPTTHFRGSVDPATAAATGINPTFAAAFRAGTGNTATPVDVWLDDAGRVRRISLPLAPPNAQLPAGSNPATVVDFYDFGTADASFAQPPANQVAGVGDLSSLGGVGD